MMVDARLGPDLTGYHAVVTGGSRGIGLAIATALIECGANVSILARDGARLAQVSSSLATKRSQLATAMVDVASEPSVGLAFAQARASFGPVDLLINNAGIAESAPFAKTTFEQYQRLVETNLTGTWLCTQACAADLLHQTSQRKRVVNIASTAGLTGYAYVTAYCAAKHGVVGLTRALAREWGRKGVTVNAVCPGYTDTDIVADAVRNIVDKTGRDAAKVRDELAQGNPQGRLVRPEEVAATVLWLVGEGSDAITGQAISVSGGEVM